MRNALVDTLNITRQFTEKEFTNSTVFSGEFNRMNIELSFRLTCSANFYGDNCETFCTPRNNSEGHFTCNSVTGQVECLPGYRDSSTNCTMTCGFQTTCGEDTQPDTVCVDRYVACLVCVLIGNTRN